MVAVSTKILRVAILLGLSWLLSFGAGRADCLRFSCDGAVGAAIEGARRQAFAYSRLK